MKKIYESPEAEVVSFAAMEQLAMLKGEVRLDLVDGDLDMGLSDAGKF